MSECGTDAARLTRMAAKLAALREKSLVEATGPVLPEALVAAFEEDNGIRLPEGYRLFLTTVGNGGPGPYKGLEALDPYLRDRQLTGAFPYGPDDLTGAFTIEMSGWSYWNYYRGTIPLARHKSVEWAYHETAEPVSLLVVSGPARGRVVMVDDRREYFPPVFHPARDFLAWYEEWLDDRAVGASSRASDFGRPGWSAATVRDHPDPEEAVWAARMLAARVGRWDWPEATPEMCETLVEAATGASSPRARAAAAWALHHVRRDAGPFALPLLEAPDPEVRREAIMAVRWSGAVGEEAVRAALRPLLDDPDPVIRAAVAPVLTGRDGHAEAVLRALLLDPDPRARLAGLGGFPSVMYRAPEHRRGPLTTAARALLRDPGEDVRARAVVALDAAEIPWGRAMLAAAALTDPAVTVRREAARRLLRYGGRSALISLVPALLDDPDFLIRHQTLVRLGRGSYRDNRIPARYWDFAVRPAVRDPDPETARAALEALVLAGRPPAEEAWATLLTSPARTTRRRALALTRDIEPDPGGPVHAILHDTLRHADLGLRGAAARSLRDVCSGACRADLEALLAAEDDETVRYRLNKIIERLSGG
ncbi:SMI1/KNR4 family protein [Actinomadura roseirufa]|uniref:SMI1/KNR4 family protein n=1 Tax=Actinomadura roseirufa TaxID=2094049 RepID=UPI0010417BC7|nr:SMI1/KNR4 family protein [Actinomadura roseirufa]